MGLIKKTSKTIMMVFCLLCLSVTFAFAKGHMAVKPKNVKTYCVWQQNAQTEAVVTGLQVTAKK